MKKDDLDKRICDVEEGTTNAETYREFIKNSCKEFFEHNPSDLEINNMTEEQLNDVIDELDYLWEK